MLNLLHSRRTSGFGLGHYLDPQTTGLWINLRPHPRNPDVQVVLMDTEGLDSPNGKIYSEIPLKNSSTMVQLDIECVGITYLYIFYLSSTFFFGNFR